MIRISPNILIEISRDGLKGYITLIEDEGNNSSKEIKMDQVLEKIKDILKIGLDEGKLINILLNKYYNEKTLIAEGKLPIDGKDGYVKYNFEENKILKPKVLEDGTVDYRELNIINNVNKGDILAELIPPKEGIPGFKVTGDIIPFKQGRYPNLRYGRNVRLLDNGVVLVADSDGLVELKDNKITVHNVYEVDNVDSSVGNIYFNGTVMVKGNALNGFQIKATGDVEIKGVIEGSYIENSGDIIVRQGIQGYNRLTIKTKGNVTTKFIENAIINSDRNITAEAIMHSQVSSKDKIEVIGKRGLIVGGIIRAGREIKARTIGSTMATITILEVGVDPEIKTRHDEIGSNIKDFESNLNKIVKSLNLLDKLKESGRIDREKLEMYLKLLKTRNSIMGELEKLKKEYKIMNETIHNLSKGKIIVSDTIYPGSRIIIGNSTMFIKDEMKRCTFYREDGEIRVGPY